MSSLDYNPETDIPDLAGKVFVTTGGTSGIGKTSILRLAAHHASHIIFIGRSRTRAGEVISEAAAISSTTKVSFVSCDLGSLESVKACGKEILALTERIDVLINNAAISTVPGGLTKEGYEVYIGTNHLAHAALTQILLPTLIRTSTLPSTSVRVITITSEAFTLAPSSGILFSKLKTNLDSSFWVLPSLRSYAHSKLANVLYSLELSKRYPQILSIVIHPGMVLTEGSAGANWFIKAIYALTPGKLTPDQGAWNTLWAATSEKDPQAMQGRWFLPVGKVGYDVKKRWLEQSQQLWEWTDKELKGNGIA